MSGSRRPPSGTRRPEKRSDPIVIDDDDEEDGFEIVGGSQPNSQASTSAGTQSKKNEEIQPLPSSEATFRSLVPDRAQLEQERLARERRRREQQAGAEAGPGSSSREMFQITPPRRDSDLRGRIPSAYFDTSGASEAIVADRNTRTFISAALRNAGLGPQGEGTAPTSGASTGSGDQERRTASVPTPASAPAVSDQAQPSASTGIHWWNNFFDGTTSVTNSSKAARPSVVNESKSSPVSPPKSSPKRASPSRRLEALPPPLPSKAPRGLSYTAAASSSQANMEKKREGFDVDDQPSKRLLSPVHLANTSSPPRKRARPLGNDASEHTRSGSGLGLSGVFQNLPKPSSSILDPYAPVQTFDRFWYGTVKTWQGVMHCKFFILFYPKSHMRFILLSGNLVDYDWDRIENTAFVQDFPALSAGDHANPDVRASKSIKTPFGRELVKLLNALSLPKPHTARERLEQYDLTGAVGSLVLSAPQRSPVIGWEQVEKWGVGRLGAVVRSKSAGVGLQPTRGGVDWEAQGSSLGEIRSRWLQHFHILASGVDPCGSKVPCIPLPSAEKRAKQRYADTLYPAPSAIVKVRPGVVPPPNVRGKARAGSTADADAQDMLIARPPPGRPRRSIDQVPADLTWPPVKICFPSLRWITRDAIEGPQGAGTFFGKKKKFMEGNFKHLFHQPRSLRGNFLMHAKVLLALHPGYDLDDALTVSGLTNASEGSSFGAGGRNLGLGRTLDEDRGRQANSTTPEKGKSADDSILISDSDDDLDSFGGAFSKPPGSSAVKQNKGKNKEASSAAASGESALERRSPPAAIGWVYSGSHNFTPSAWGTLTEKNGLPSLSMSNWELGIVLPLYDARDRSEAASKGDFDLQAHVSTLAKNLVPYSRPAERYLPTDEPWDQSVPENRALMGFDS
ncbi:hypothetical protein OC846_004868 [Tilletia horrida]|uniref:Uncharacterized protein n=1 Tax=Tilletia horrida TaxID=155126 RepID=A0AAN6GMH9_9BASI|nr:hypothetical protein OC846_004868 [Tilletia horrida]